MPFVLPPPPKSRGIVGLLVTFGLVGWTGYLLFVQANKKPEPKKAAPLTVENGPTFVEIDLRGPQYEAGRYAGYQKGLESKSKGFTQPAANVLQFSARETAEKQAVAANETEDFIAGYESGFTQAMKMVTPVPTPISVPQK